MVELYLTRHGQTEENIKGILQGQTDGTLSEMGLRQAEELAEYMEGTELDVIVSSPLLRSRRTAQAVAERRPEALFVQTDLLSEIDTGIYTSRPTSLVDWNNLPHTGMETVSQMYARAERFLKWLRKNYNGKCVLAVGHGAYNRAIICAINRVDPQQMQQMPIMGNTQVLHFFI